jgi:hypothetical protein
MSFLKEEPRGEKKRERERERERERAVDWKAVGLGCNAGRGEVVSAGFVAYIWAILIDGAMEIHLKLSMRLSSVS